MLLFTRMSAVAGEKSAVVKGCMSARGLEEEDVRNLAHGAAMDPKCSTLTSTPAPLGKQWEMHRLTPGFARVEANAMGNPLPCTSAAAVCTY